MRSPVAVEPRMSANSKLAGISAPGAPILLRLLMHRPQMAGFPGKRANPRCRRTAPPGPSNGAAQSLQCGSEDARHEPPEACGLRVFARQEAPHRVFGRSWTRHLAAGMLANAWERVSPKESR